ILWAAGSTDIVSKMFGISFEMIVTTLQVALIVGPPVAFDITRRICLGLQRKDREVLLHGHETGRIVRTSEGGYVEEHQPADAAEHALLAVTPAPISPAKRDRDGRMSRRERLRAALAARFETGRVAFDPAHHEQVPAQER